MTVVRKSRIAVLLLPCLLTSLPAIGQLVEPTTRRDAQSGTVPFVLDGNRVYAEVVVAGPNGRPHRTLAFVDTGSPATFVSMSLIRELDLDRAKPFVVRIGKLSLSIDGSTVNPDSSLPASLGPGRNVEMVLPAGVLQHYQIALDYAQRTLTVATPGTQPDTPHPDGIPVPFRISQKTGLIVVDAVIDGDTYPITIDVGSAYTWIRKTTAQKWLVRHPEWQRGVGAAGPSNMRVADDGVEADGILVRIPSVQLGSLLIGEVGALAIGPDVHHQNFMDWYSQKNPTPVIGWLGGNVLKAFRITIDYPNHISWWRREGVAPQELDQVGLTLVSRNGGWFVARVVEQDHRPTVPGVQEGDKLLQIDSLRTANASLGQIFSAMHGQPREHHTLVLQRGRKVLTVEAPVTAF